MVGPWSPSPLQQLSTALLLLLLLLLSAASELPEPLAMRRLAGARCARAIRSCWMDLPSAAVARARREVATVLLPYLWVGDPFNND